MCAYCVCADWAFRYNPPWPNTPEFPWDPRIPQPLTPGPHVPWTYPKLKDFQAVLEEIKKIEECPCDPNKPDYLKLLQDRIDILIAKKCKNVS